MTSTETDVRQAFLKQAKSCEDLGSAFTARLCRLAAKHMRADTAVEERILSWPGNATATGDALALRLAGSLHALVLSGQSAALADIYPPKAAEDAMLWASVKAAFIDHQAFILDRLTSAPQTNEVRRSAALLPGFLTIAQLTAKPLMLSEVGASAGLNLNWDKYAYTFGSTTWGGTSTVSLAPDWQGQPLPNAELSVTNRAGCDLNPLNPASAEDRLRLMSYIWADQADRLERTRHALEIAVANNVVVDRADAIDWLKRRLSQQHTGVTHVIYHTIAWQYLPDALKAKGEALIAAAGKKATADAPLARLQMEADGKTDGAALTLQIWPTGERHEIGRADFHGRWINWKGWPSA